MADPTYPLVNGNRYSWASVEIAVNNLRLKGVKELSFKNGLEPGEMRGTGPQKLGRTRGDLKPEAAITLYMQEFYALQAALGEGYMEVEFGIVASFSDRNQPIVTVEIIGCRIKSEDHSFSQGTDALTVKCDLDVMMVITNGVKPIIGMLGV